MKILTSSKVFKLTYPLLIQMDEKVQELNELRNELNGSMPSSEFWIDDIEPVHYGEDGPKNVLLFNFRITRVLPIDADVNHLQMINRIVIELEKVLLVALEERGK